MADVETDNVPITEQAVLEAERIRIAERRSILEQLLKSDSAKAKRKPHTHVPLSALCFSGGGVRSASFCLGVARALAHHNLLKNFDYLSTVSGGGFTGAFLSRWANEQGYEEVENVLKNDSAFSGGTDAAYPLLHLRRYIAYLTPKLGLLSYDSLAVITLYFRNVFLHWLVMVPWLLFVCLLPQLLDNLLHFFQLASLPYQSAFFALAAGGFGWVYRINSAALRDPTAKDPDIKHFVSQFVFPSFGILLCLTMTIGNNGLLSTLSKLSARGADNPPANYCGFDGNSLWCNIFVSNGLVGWLLFAFTAVFIIWHALRQTRTQRESLKKKTSLNDEQIENITFRGNFLILASQLIAGIIVLGICELVLNLFSESVAIQAAIVMLPALLQLSYLASDAIYNAGHSRQSWTEMNQEWTGRIGGSLITLPLLWAVVSAVALWAPATLNRLSSSGGFNPILTFGGATTLTGAVGYVLSQLTGIIGKTKSSFESWKSVGLRWGLWIVLVLFSFFLLVLLSLLGWETTNFLRLNLLPHVGNFSNALANIYLDCTIAVIALMIISGLVSRWVDSFTNLNRFSLHQIYRNRLIRTFVGAANPERKRHKRGFLDMLATDNIPLFSLGAVYKRDKVPPSYHVINMSLNIPGSQELGFQERKAVSFLASPQFVGSSALPLSNPTGCFRSAKTYASQDDTKGVQPFSLGGAIAISGAAFDPSMGRQGSTSMRLLFTIANIRLGAWLGNPNVSGNSTYKLKGPRYIMKQLAYEFFGLANEDRDFVHLSDGGHFENLAVYEMLRRRCGLLFVVDAGCDQSFSFDDLGTLQRLAKVDLNADIIVPPAQLAKLTAGKVSFVKAIIIYRDKETNKETSRGDLYYVKPSVPQNAQPEIETYRRANPSFPHQTTLNQFFTESQFLAYMALGKRQGEDMIHEIIKRPPSQFKEWFT